jgi:hypothetical protein
MLTWVIFKTEYPCQRLPLSIDLNDLRSQVVLGKDSRRQFKRDVTNVGGLAAEMAALSRAGKCRLQSHR